MHLVERQQLTATAWNEAIRNFNGTNLFHQSAWLSYLEGVHSGRRLLVEIQDNDRTIGFFPAILVQRGPFQLLGSPLKGSWTIQMGPVAEALDTRDFLSALDKFCRDKRISYVELGSPLLDPQVLLEAGFSQQENVTYLLPIKSPEEMWQQMRSNARNHIRQAQRYGLEVVAADDPSVMKEFYFQYRAVLARKGLDLHYPLSMFTALWESLYPSGNLLVWRMMYRGRSIATNIFAFDDKTIYWWASATAPDAYGLRPNEFVQWAAINFAVERGIRLYDMYGEGGFKEKFGARRVPRPTWYKALSLSAKIARETYKSFFYGRQEVLHLLRSCGQRIFGSPNDPATVRDQNEENKATR